MRVRDFAVPLTLLGGIAAFIVGVKMRQQPVSSVAAPAQRAERADTESAAVRPQDNAATVAGPPASSAGQVGDQTLVQSSSESAPARDTAAVNAVIREGSAGTYLREILDRQSGALVRWPSRLSAVRVWIERDRLGPDWLPAYPVVAERAFTEWQEAGFPLRFDIVRDSASAEIRILWIDQFSQDFGDQIGVARTARDQHGWLHRAEITIATHDRLGRPLPPSLVAGTARHEVGHALGLGHSSSPGDVMHPESKSPVISSADRRTLHVLYLLPPGPVK